MIATAHPRKPGGKINGGKPKVHPGKRSRILGRAEGGAIPPDVEQYFQKRPPYEIDVDKEADVLRTAKAKESGGFTGRLDKLRPLNTIIDQKMETAPGEDSTRDKTDIIPRSSPGLRETQAKRGGRITKVRFAGGPV